MCCHTAEVITIKQQPSQRACHSSPVASSLHGKHLRIAAAGADKVVVRPILADPPVVQHHDAAGHSHG